MCCDQVAGAGLLQILFSLLSETGGDHSEPLLVQLTSQEVAKARVAAGDVHIFAALVRDPGQLPDPAVQVVENHQPQEVQVHDCSNREGKLISTQYRLCAKLV